MSRSGPILLISTYEMGHQPLNLASPLATLAEAGLEAAALDTGVQPLSAAAVQAAWFIGISVPMHTATRLALPLIEQIRALNPDVHLCCYGLYAALNADYLLSCGVDFIIGGEYEAPLRALVLALAQGSPPPPAVTTRQRRAAPHLAKIPFAAPRRQGLPDPGHYARFE